MECGEQIKSFKRSGVDLRVRQAHGRRKFAGRLKTVRCQGVGPACQRQERRRAGLGPCARERKRGQTGRGRPARWTPVFNFFCSFFYLEFFGFYWIYLEMFF